MRRNNSENLWLALDAGTTGVKAFAFGTGERVLSRAYEPLKKSFPRPGWIEQDPSEILAAVKNALCAAVRDGGVEAREFAGMGIANQRETVILWDRRTGEPVYPAIVWEDARTKEQCAALEDSYGALAPERTGLPIIPYFSASKVRWILDEVPGARERAKKGELCFGTVDSWLLWNLADGHPHSTDYTNAARTLLFNIRTKEWDDELLALFAVPRAILPEVKESLSLFGTLADDIAGAPIPIRAVAGDQQASLYAAGADIGTTKITFGTGIFIMQIVGGDFVELPPFFTTLAAGKRGQPVFALEAKIESCAARVSPLIGREREMGALMDEFAAKVAPFIRKLPLRPKELVIDGGVTQAKHLRAALERITGLPIREHALFDGTALGLARLAQSRVG
jgi:glycerol kinase